MSLKQKALTGIKWTSISAILSALLQFGQISILARLLDSQAFGLMALILVVVNFSELFMDLGITNSIIQKKNILTKELSSLYWLNIFLGIMITLVVWNTSWVIANVIFHEPILENYIKLVSINFVIMSLGQQYKALLLKELIFNLISKIEVFSYLLGVICSIIFACVGYEVESLIYGLLINNIVRTILLLIVGTKRYRPKLYFNFNDTKRFLNFGLYQMGVSIVNYFNSRIDTLIIGRVVGAVALGFYTIPFNIIIQPSIKINPIITRVLFPVFSEIQDDINTIKKSYFKVLSILTYVNLPIFCGLFFISPVLIPVIFGENWSPSILILQILCGVGFLRAIGNPVGSLLMAIGKVDLEFKFNVIKTIIQIPGIYLGAKTGGILGAAVVYLVLQIFYAFFNYFYLLRNVFGPCFKDYLKTFIPAIKPTFIMSIIVWACGKIITTNNEILIMTLQILVGVLSYLIISIFYNNWIIIEVKELIKKRRKNV